MPFVSKKNSLWRFVLPSSLGVLLFLVPVSYEGTCAIVVAHMAKQLYAYLGVTFSVIMMVCLAVSACMTLGATCVAPTLFRGTALHYFVTTPEWVLVRLLASFGALLILYQAGPTWLWHHKTGRLMLYELLPKLFANLLFASFFGHLLVAFGLLEFVGVLATSLMRPLFRLPGRAAVNCVTSWIGDGTMGTVMAMKEYEKGHYTARETTIVITCFSAVSITFYATILSTLRLESYFGPFCLTVVTSSLLAALFLVRVPPIRSLPAAYIDGKTLPPSPNTSKKASLWQQAMQAACTKAAASPSLMTCMRQSMNNMVEIIATILPGVMVIGTTGLIIGKYTPLFAILGKPFVWFLDACYVGEASKASECILIGFADMFMPVALAEEIHTPMTRFIIGALSITQIIYLSELGPLLLGRKQFSLRFVHLLSIFLLRTCITLPMIVLCAHIFVGM